MLFSPGLKAKFMYVIQDNILIFRPDYPVICDFGISRMLYNSQTFGAESSTNSNCARGTVRWMAVELLAIDVFTKHTKCTDVWAYGMTVYVRT